MVALFSAWGWVRFMHDLPGLRTRFAKLGREGWEKLIEADRLDEPVDPVQKQAWAIFTREYGLDDEAEERVTVSPLAAQEYMADYAADRIPGWVLDMALTPEIKASAGTKGG